jgi:hypothetical protein
VLAMSLLTMAGPRYGRFGGEYSFTPSNIGWLTLAGGPIGRTWGADGVD